MGGERVVVPAAGVRAQHHVARSLGSRQPTDPSPGRLVGQGLRARVGGDRMPGPGEPVGEVTRADEATERGQAAIGACVDDEQPHLGGIEQHLARSHVAQGLAPFVGRGVAPGVRDHGPAGDVEQGDGARTGLVAQVRPRRRAAQLLSEHGGLEQPGQTRQAEVGDDQPLVGLSCRQHWRHPLRGVAGGRRRARRHAGPAPRRGGRRR